MQILRTWAIAAMAASAIFQAPPSRSDPVLVRYVLDGDTIEVSSIGRVRLLGIDAPEIGRGFDTAAPFAVEARDRLKALVNHKWVRLEFDGPHQDVYSRRLAYVVLDDGRCANTMLLEEGLARISARIPLARLDELRRAEAQAQGFHRGMWGNGSVTTESPYAADPPVPSKRTKKGTAAAPDTPNGEPPADTVYKIKVPKTPKARKKAGGSERSPSTSIERR